MDLDDSFAERIIRKNKARKEYFNEKGADICSVGKKRVVLIEENQLNPDYPTEESPKRQCTENLQPAYSSPEKENIELQKEDADAAYVPIHSASKVRGLAALKRFSNDDDEEESRTTELQVNKCNTYVYSTNSSDLCIKPKSRLANLAANIRQWEDDTRQPTLSSNNVTSNNNTKYQMPLSNTPSSTAKSNFSVKLYYTNNTPSNANSSGKQHVGQSSLSNCTVSIPGNGGLKPVSACKRGNIDSGSVGGMQKKILAWDQAVSAALETPTSVKSPVKLLTGTSGSKSSQNFNPHHKESSDDESIDENDFAENYSDIKSDNGSNKMEWEDSPVKEVRKQEKLNEVVKTQTTIEKPIAPALQESTASNVDPAELPLSARKALFEKALFGGTPKVNEDVVDQKLSVAQRAAMFENASKTKSETKNINFKEPSRIAFSNFSKFDKNSNTQTVKSPVKTIAQPSFEKVKASPVKKPSSTTTSTPSPTKSVGSHTRFIQQQLLESTGSNSQGKEVAKAVEERKKEISSLVNRWEKLSSSSSVENNSEEGKSNSLSKERTSLESDTAPEEEFEEESDYDDVNDRENLDDEIHTNAIEDDQDIEEEDEDDKESNNAENVFYAQKDERENVKISEKKYFKNEERADILSSSSNNNRSGSSSLSGGMSSYTDDSSYHASNSHSCSSGSSVRSYDVSPRLQDINTERSEDARQSKNPEIPLLYTVSFYRKQKQETRLTPVRTIVRREKVSSPESPPDTDYTEIIQQRLKGLQEEILRQQTIISQTSQALNLCSATAEFSGSTEQVEGERLLLIATQKRQACLNEMTRLKTCGAQGENIAEGTGTLTITDLQLPLKREFITCQLEGKGNDTVHYFLCLIRHGAQVIVTQMMSSDDRTADGALCFTNHIQLRDLPADFSVVFEVYALQTKKEVLPHEKKYHIKREHSKIRLTPKGRKGDNKLPAISSPGGPNAVRSPSFGVVGFTRFTLQNCNKRTFTLDKVPFTSPLDGVLRVKLQLHAEHKVIEKGFLTMFEDVSGFGAWHRRWCVLNANNVAYWKYPDEEHKKEPIGIIDLKKCVTGVVKLVSRDICARPHTFQLVTVRPQEKGDKNTLISRSVNTLTTTKHLLSADTKDERILWCNKLNEALTNVRKWDPQALRPVTSMQD